MKGKNVYLHVAAAAFLLTSVMSLPNAVVFGQETAEPEAVHTDVDSGPVYSAPEKPQEASENQVSLPVLDPNIRAEENTGQKTEENIDQKTEGKTAAESEKETKPETEKPRAERPYTVIPTMETSLQKDVYQSYETIYVHLSAPEGYAIYYTLDGSEATAASARYEKPFPISAPSAAGGNVTLHAIAVLSNS